MRVIEPSIRIVDALCEWGLYEASNQVKYPPSGVEAPADACERIAFGVEFAMRHAPKVVAELLCAELLEPRASGAFRVEFEREDIPKLMHLFGVPITSMPDHLEHVQRLVGTADWNPIVCAVQIGRRDVGPFVIFDGCHRAKAWTLRDDSRGLRASVIWTQTSPLRVKPGSPCDFRSGG